MAAKRGMDPSAVKCIWAAVGCFIFGGAMIVAVSPQSFGVLHEALGETATLVVQSILLVVQWAILATGASLVGAAVVIQWLGSNILHRVRAEKGKSTE